jgi:hypothetical protein
MSDGDKHEPEQNFSRHREISRAIPDRSRTANADITGWRRADPHRAIITYPREDTINADTLSESVLGVQNIMLNKQNFSDSTKRHKLDTQNTMLGAHNLAGSINHHTAGAQAIMLSATNFSGSTKRHKLDTQNTMLGAHNFAGSVKSQSAGEQISMLSEQDLACSIGGGLVHPTRGSRDRRRGIGRFLSRHAD